MVLLALAACAGTEGAPQPSGPFRALNAGHWTPSADELRGPVPTPPAAWTFPSEAGS